MNGIISWNEYTYIVKIRVSGGYESGTMNYNYPAALGQLPTSAIRSFIWYHPVQRAQPSRAFRTPPRSAAAAEREKTTTSTINNTTTTTTTTTTITGDHS